MDVGALLGVGALLELPLMPMDADAAVLTDEVSVLAGTRAEPSMVVLLTDEDREGDEEEGSDMDTTVEPKLVVPAEDEVADLVACTDEEAVHGGGGFSDVVEEDGALGCTVLDNTWVGLVNDEDEVDETVLNAFEALITSSETIVGLGSMLTQDAQLLASVAEAL